MKQRILGFLVLSGLLLSGCSLGPREDWAESMRDAYEQARKSPGAHVHISASVRVIETTIRVVPAPIFRSLDGVVDFKTRTSKLTAKGAATTKGSTLYYQDLVDVFPRSAGARAASNADKHWASFDFRRKPKEDPDANDRLISLGYVIAPSLAVELLQGVLAGSAKDLGKESVAGAAATKYYIRLAPDAATREVRNQRRLDGITRMLSTIGVREDIFPIYVWMDEQGLARRIRFILEQDQDVVNRFRTIVQYDFSSYGAAAPIPLPPADDTAKHRRFLDFITDYIRV